MSSDTHQMQERRPSFEIEPRAAVQAGGWLVLAAVLGSIVTDWTMWLLLPAGLLVAAALHHWAVSAGGASTRIGGLIAAGALVAAAVLTLAGLLVTGRLGMEPDWLVRSTELVGLATMGGLAAVGIGQVRSDERLTGLLLTVALPVGLAIDRFLAANLHQGFVLHGGGFYLAAILLAVGLIRLGRRPGDAPVHSRVTLAG